MKIKLVLPFVVLGIAAGALGQRTYILRYTESAPLGQFLAQYQLQLEATVPGRPIHAVVDTANRPPAALIQQISDDTDDDVSIELDQATRLPILEFRQKQYGGLNAIQGLLQNPSQVPLFGLSVPIAMKQQPAISQASIGQSWASHGAGPSAIVAVIDTGIDPAHPIFRGNSVPGVDYLSRTGTGSELTGLPPSVLAYINPTTTPLLGVRVHHLSGGHAPIWGRDMNTRLNSSIPVGLGHGTMVAGAIALVSPNVRILPIRAFSQNGQGRLFDVIRGLHAAEDRGAQIVNLSLNTPTFSPELERSVDELSDRGLIIVASTGNEGRLNPLSYPARFTKVTGVASVDRFGNRSTFSNSGVDLTWVAAPGEALVLPFPGNRYAVGWGTSFSAPLVSGMAAKLLALKPQATYSDLQSALGRSDPNPNPNLGLGTLNVFASIEGM